YRRQRRLSKSRRAVQQDVVERFAALLRRRDRNLQLLADAVLPDVFVERPRAESRLVLDVVVNRRRVDEPVVTHARVIIFPRGFAPRTPNTRTRGDPVPRSVRVARSRCSLATLAAEPAQSSDHSS